jgi:hypothetical protein
MIDAKKELTTPDLCVKICQEARASGYQSSVCYDLTSNHKTAVVVISNPERMFGGGDVIAPRFCVTKIHLGKIVSEQFV